MGTSSGKSFPTSNINPGHTHFDERVSPARAYMYKGGDATDLINSWTEIDLADNPDIFVKGDINGNVPLIRGGTGATTAADALAALDGSPGLIPKYNRVGSDVILLPHYIVGIITFPTIIGSNGNIKLRPLYIETTRTLSALFLHVTTLNAGQAVNIAIYDNLNFRPNNLLLDAGSILTDTTGLKSVVTSLILSPGLYWIATETTSNTAVCVAFSQVNMICTTGTTTTTLSTGFYTGLQSNTSWGGYGNAWPAVFGLCTPITTNIELVGFQFSA